MSTTETPDAAKFINLISAGIYEKDYVQPVTIFADELIHGLCALTKSISETLIFHSIGKPLEDHELLMQQAIGAKCLASLLRQYMENVQDDKLTPTEHEFERADS